MDGAQFNARRKYPRRAFDRRVGVLVRGFYFMALAGEIGEGGMSFETVDEIPIGSELVVNLKIPDGDFVSMRAEVRSSVQRADSSQLAGVSFKNVPFSLRRQIRSYVSSRMVGEAVRYD